MEWRDEGVLLSVRPHGESSAIIEVFTAAHGRHAGVVRGGTSRRMAPILQPGAQLDVVWRARLDDHIGAFVAEPLRVRAGILSDRLALSGLNSVCALLRLALPERDPHPDLWRATVDLIEAMEAGAGWPVLYVQWELGLLEALGFGLDLAACAVTGTMEGLAFVSPRTGRAVSRPAAGAWADRLLPLPGFLIGQGVAGPSDLRVGLALTGHFLTRELARDRQDGSLPMARARLVQALSSHV